MWIPARYKDSLLVGVWNGCKITVWLINELDDTTLRFWLWLIKLFYFLSLTSFCSAYATLIKLAAAACLPDTGSPLELEPVVSCNTTWIFFVLFCVLKFQEVPSYKKRVKAKSTNTKPSINLFNIFLKIHINFSALLCQLSSRHKCLADRTFQLQLWSQSKTLPGRVPRGC